MRRRLQSIARWAERARRIVPPADLSHFGPMGVWETVSGYLARRGPPPGGDRLEARDPAFVDLVLDAVAALGEHWFRLRLEGVDHVPASGGALLVGNHNGGILATDALFTVLAIRDRHGPGRAVHPLAHDLLFQDRVGRGWADRFGVLRAGHGPAEAALADGRLVLVYPGSDLDTWRPFHHRHRVVLGGRTGFARLALRAGVPIVPVVSTGTHEQMVALTRLRGLARALGLKRRLRTEAFPLILALPWGLTSGYLPYLPLPAQTTVRFGAPLAWPDLGPDRADDPAALDRVYRDVEASMQAMLTDLGRGRVPWLGKLSSASSR